MRMHDAILLRPLSLQQNLHEAVKSVTTESEEEESVLWCKGEEADGLDAVMTKPLTHL
jgi:hypothetical protein